MLLRIFRKVLNFTRRDVFWLVAYVVLTGILVQRSILWLFFSEFGGGVTQTVVLDLWIWGATWGILFSVWLWFVIARNMFQTAMLRLMIFLLLLGLLCNWVLLYAVTYLYLGLLDVEREVREPITCFYFSVVTWTTLGYGDVRPSMAARLVAASEALLGYIWMGLFIGALATLFKQPTQRAVTS